VSGLNGTTAKNIVAYREENGPFSARTELKKVPKLGPKAFEQCAGFLRVPGGRNVLDNTAVHPESYEAVKALLAETGYTLKDVADGTIRDLPGKVKAAGTVDLCRKLGIGEPTLNDIINELMKPGRDIRDSLPQPILRKDVMDIADLKPGMKLMGTVRNVIDFGAFVDIGVHQDGLVHISEIADRYIKHPSEVLSVGDIVEVVVTEVDEKRHRIGLSIRKAREGK
ncbi:MAG: S1 RNA-binding domain-containing protein, partial [Oscillospiraceae bacterium]|nr:S1 RNA-binding domain-containing protein [Oscillospiraceae bacterium]